MDFIESITIKNKQTLNIDMASTYVTISYIGNISMKKHYIWNEIEITEGGGSIISNLLTLDELTKRLNDLTLNDIKKYHAIVEYLDNK